eukprot:CAMPEP_0172497182 /NCGR_PEP_ID=MMETSP1066-20121228/96301_1 /TAXON_ID=671091 /ORGANISM="Coscinodiscus wailesii, Strain CCMP2513" /LENGTH=191 /DNA_ID=CAMNT_0013269809 /DNA_START=42 /DNA_END=617 /DNA_ORIENTATION=-
MRSLSTLAIAAFLGLVSVESFSLKPQNTPNTSTKPTGRREFFGGAAAILAGAAVIPQTASAYNLGDPNSVVGREIQSFNSLIYNFENTSLNGLDASKIKEPSVPFIEFGKRMKAGEVEFVEFFAPNGDVAYATFKPKEGEKKGERIRIGQGYPTETKGSWSNPAYVIRSVSNFGVPYRFVVPALEKYRLKA